MKELGRSPSSTHNKRSLIRTSQVYHRRLAVGRNQQVNEYKHTQTHTEREREREREKPFHMPSLYTSFTAIFLE